MTTTEIALKRALEWSLDEALWDSDFEQISFDEKADVLLKLESEVREFAEELAPDPFEVEVVK